MWLWIILGVAAGAVLIAFLIAFICFCRVFYSPKRKLPGPDEYETLQGEIYEVFREAMIDWVKTARALPHEDVEIKSFDGLTLRGKYYEHHKGAIVEILFHGYGGYSERDLSGGIERCFALGRNVLLVDQRGAGRSDGHVVTFGINERRDCLAWINFVINKFGADVKIIITGVSMGAATVMMAAGEQELPDNVVCVLADCGYSTAREIIKKVIREMHLPANLLYPFVKLGARVFGRFDLEETTPLEAVKKSRVPIIFIHGDTDAFVPCDMSRELFRACAAPKKFKVIKGAGHGLAYPIDKEEYLAALADFQRECGF
ncbi:MAG: alpha/beta hydrolase [Clostridia bacterium]|nr:alpha/beta hydrolase [Clostridia bacterium]